MEKASKYFEGKLKTHDTIDQNGTTYIVRRVEENGDVIIFDLYDKEQKESILKGKYLLTGMSIGE